MPTIDVVLPPLHPAQAHIDNNARRFNVICAGRRFGKDILGQRRIVRKALNRRQPVAWFAPTYRMLLENWRQIRNLLAPVTVRASDSEHRIDLVTGQPLEMWSLDNHDAARGRKYGYVFINEAAMVKDLVDAWNMVIRPTLADMRGGADFGSTPRGLNGFYDIWKDAEGGEDWARFHYRTDDNPFIPVGEIAAMRAALPERVVRQEIDAEFVEDGSFFQNVDAAAVIQQKDTPQQHQGHTILMAGDWGKSGDWTVLGAACRDCNRVVDWERFNKIDYTFQRARLRAMYNTWKPVGVLPERNSIGEPNIEDLIQDGVTILPGPDGKPGFYTTPSNKPALIEGLAAALYRHKFLVPADAGDELRAFEVETLQTGYSRYSAPSGRHDDWVMMLAILWHAVTRIVSWNDVSDLGKVDNYVSPWQ